MCPHTYVHLSVALTKYNVIAMKIDVLYRLRDNNKTKSPQVQYVHGFMFSLPLI